jgi:hypothetical protein
MTLTGQKKERDLHGESSLNRTAAHYLLRLEQPAKIPLCVDGVWRRSPYIRIILLSTRTERPLVDSLASSTLLWVVKTHVTECHI